MIERRSLGYSVSSDVPPAVLPHAPNAAAEITTAQVTPTRRIV
jgi:hypothetical protein